MPLRLANPRCFFARVLRCRAGGPRARNAHPQPAAGILPCSGGTHSCLDVGVALGYEFT